METGKIKLMAVFSVRGQNLKQASACLIIGVIIVMTFWYFERFFTDFVNNRRSTTSISPKYGMCIDDRKKLSRKMTNIMQKYHMLQCSVSDKFTETGGWCNKAVETGHMTDNNFATALAEMLKTKSIGSFGDGKGEYRKFLLNTGLITRYDSYDGSPFIENLTDNAVKFLDLTLNNFGLPIYDYILSTEVAEHIPMEYENVYLSNVIRHAREGIVISWAVPGQGGYQHINLRSKEYVLDKFSKLCFDFEEEKSNLLRSKSNLPWLRNNLMIFRRRSACPINEEEA